jgi:hypothetical protein
VYKESVHRPGRAALALVPAPLAPERKGASAVVLCVLLVLTEISDDMFVSTKIWLMDMCPWMSAGLQSLSRNAQYGACISHSCRYSCTACLVQVTVLDSTTTHNLGTRLRYGKQRKRIGLVLPQTVADRGVARVCGPIIGKRADKAEIYCIQ